jgi:hypothetical protein
MFGGKKNYLTTEDTEDTEDTEGALRAPAMLQRSLDFWRGAKRLSVSSVVLRVLRGKKKTTPRLQRAG